MFYVYFLLLSNLDIYKGFTDDLKRRYREHQQGKVKATMDRRPLKLIGYEAYLLKSDAQRREKFLKTTEGRRFLRMQYRDIFDKYKVETGKGAGVVERDCLESSCARKSTVGSNPTPSAK